MSEPSSFYTGPGRPRLHARDWAAMVAATESGSLDETSWVELKEAVPASSAPANLEMAKDLASLSVDGGVLIVGIRDKTREVVGATDLGRLADRVIQVASARVHPPLHVEPYAVGHPDDSQRGVLVVSVFASPDAPHMVDGQYWGRSAEGKRSLGDSEVARLFAQRRHRAETLEADVRATSSALDPIPVSDRRHGHLYVLLRPRGHVTTNLTDVWLGGHLLALTNEALNENRANPNWNPSLHSLPYNRGHPDGLLASSQDPGEAVREEHLLQVHVSDHGLVQAVLGCGTRSWRTQPGEVEADVVSASHLLELTHSLVLLAGHISTTYLAYWGTWEAGANLTSVQGLYASEARSQMTLARFNPYPQREYFRATSTTTRELVDAPAGVVAKLMGPLLRGLGVEQRYLPYERMGDILQRAR